MKLAIADPPYLGRANRWYGTGRGHQGGRGRPDQHAAAADWDRLDTHLALIAELEAEYDGWAYAGAPDYEHLVRAAAPDTVRKLIWHRGNAIASGARVRSTYEFVLVQIPESRRGYGTGLAVDDVLHAGIQTRQGFVGAKPEAWTRWVLAALGHDPAVDQVVDVFHGSGAVAAATDGLLPLYDPEPAPAR